MEIEEIKRAQSKVYKLESIQRQIKELEKTSEADSVSVKRYQNGSREYSYDVCIDDDTEFIQTIRTLIKDHLTRRETKLIREIEKIRG